MDEDILTLMEALSTQTSDTDLNPVAAASSEVAPPGQTLPLEGAQYTADHELNNRQKNMHEKKTEETRDMVSFSPCLSAEVPGQCMDVALEVSSSTNYGCNGRKKNSRKGRNKRKSKTVYLSWPVMLKTQASSTSPFPCQASVMGTPSSSKERRRKNEKEKAVVLAQFWQEPAGALLPEASPVPPSLEEISVEARKERKTQKRHHCKRIAKKNQKIDSSPWPVTVQAWASFVSPDLVKTGFMEFLPGANDGIEDDVSVLALSKGTQVNFLGSPAPLVQVSWEEMSPDVNSKRKMNKKNNNKKKKNKKKNKKKHKWSQRKKDNFLEHTRLPEIQSWAPVQAAAAKEEEPVQTLSEDMPLQWEYWLPLESEEERKCFIPWSEGKEEGPFFSAIAPLQISLKEASAMKIRQSKTDRAKRIPDIGEEQLQGSTALGLESYQRWGNREKGQDGDDWEYSIWDLATQADCYCGYLFSQERSEASTFTGSNASTSISETEIGRQEVEEDKATFQTLWTGKWGGF